MGLQIAIIGQGGSSLRGRGAFVEFGEPGNTLGIGLEIAAIRFIGVEFHNPVMQRGQVSVSHQRPKRRIRRGHVFYVYRQFGSQQVGKQHSRVFSGHRFWIPGHQVAAQVGSLFAEEFGRFVGEWLVGIAPVGQCLCQRETINGLGGLPPAERHGPFESLPIQGFLVGSGPGICYKLLMHKPQPGQVSIGEGRRAGAGQVGVYG